jgi:hypothetical protein
MTVQQAIEILEVNAICSPKATKFKGAVEVAKQALEKQIPKKPIKDDLSYSGYKCPACDSNLYRLRSHNVCKTPCCIFCGQALDWSDTE